MSLPTTITAAELADLDNPRAAAFWAAVDRGQARVLWHEVPIIGVTYDRWQKAIYLVVDRTLSWVVDPAMPLQLERVAQ